MAELSQLLAEAWRFHAADLGYAPVGFGSYHWLATNARGARRFVTVDELEDGGGGDATASFELLGRALETAYALRAAAGLSFVVAPLLTTDGAVLRLLGSTYAAALYPFVDGQPYPDGPEATAEDRPAVVDMLAQVHGATPAVQALGGGRRGAARS